MAFLDPHKPLSTCASKDCVDCPVKEFLHCHFTARDLMRFLALVLPPFLVGGVGVYRYRGWALVPWLLLVVGYFGLIEIRAMCSHCPHYAEPTGALQCWANYGSPKLWRYRPGPMTAGEQAVFWVGLVGVLGYPVAFMVSGLQWLLLTGYVLLGAVAYGLMRRLMCSRCMNFACPLNRVGQALREEFFERNPQVKEAWKRVYR